MRSKTRLLGEALLRSAWVLAASAMLTAALWSQDTPTAEELAQAKERIVSAEWLIAAGKVAEGKRELEAVRPVAEEHLAEYWRFANKLTEPVTSEQAGKLAEADQLLRETAALAKEPDQINAVLMVGTRIVPALIKVGKSAQARELVMALEGNLVMGNEDAPAHCRMAGLWLKVSDAVKGEVQLKKAAPLAKTASEWSMWGWGCASLLRALKTVDEQLAAYSRLMELAAVAESKSGKKIAADTLLGVARQLTAVGDTEGANRILETVKDVVAELPMLDPTVKVVKYLISARTLSKAGDHVGALKALQDAYALVKDTSSKEAVNIYYAGYTLTQGRLKAKDQESAIALLDFLASGPGSAIDPWRLRMDLAGLRRQAGDTAKAEEALIQAAPLSKTAGQRGQWVSQAWRCTWGTKTAEEALGVYDRLAEAAKANGLAEMLLRRYLDQARLKLTLDWYGRTVDEGIVLFEGVKERAAGMEGLADEIRMTERIAAVCALSKAGNYAELLGAMQEAYEVAKDNDQVMGGLYRQGARLLAQLVKAKRLAEAEGFVDFLAQKALRRASGLKTPEEQWKAWAKLAWPVVELGASPKEVTEIYGRMLGLTEAETAKGMLSAMLLNKARYKLIHRKGLKEGTAYFEAAEKSAAGIASVVDDLTLTECMIKAHAQYKDGQHKEMMDTLVRAFSLTKGEREKVEQVYWEARYLIGESLKGGTVRANRSNIESRLASILLEVIEAGDAIQETEHLLSHYARAAVASGKGKSALRVLLSHRATAANYLELAQLHRDYGNWEEAREALAAIPEEALRTDGKLARAVAEFWPAPVKKVEEEIQRLSSLVGVYQGRLDEARAAGDEYQVKKYQALVHSLEKKVVDLEAERAALLAKEGEK